jgi:OHCU decarboxylase
VLLNIELDQLNAFSRERAGAEFLKCCGSSRWAESMTDARPFTSPERLFEKADSVWRSLSTADWLEAFRAHPKIGEKKPVATQSEQAQAWSAQEQAGVENASTRTMADLTERNREYEQRFGFIFIVCATGKSSEEMLAILNGRMRNDRDTELRIAAEEQRKITQLRLERLLNQ